MLEFSEHESLGKRTLIEPKKLKLKKVPYLEIHNNRLQGVVSSGSDIKRVYVCVIDLNDGSYTCHTNNNRPCGGLRGRMCSHLKALIGEADKIFSPQNMARFNDMTQFQARGDKRHPQVFARFQNYLRFLELEVSGEQIPEMRWFI